MSSIIARARNSYTRIEDIDQDLRVIGESDMVKVDRAVALDGLAILSGWHSNGLELSATNLKYITSYHRPDVERQFGATAIGFVLVASGANSDRIDLRITSATESFETGVAFDRNNGSAAALIEEQLPRLVELVPTIAQSPLWISLLQPHISDAAPARVGGCIDRALVLEGVGLAISGWAFAPRGVHFGVATEDGYFPLEQACRIKRPDVASTFAEDDGPVAGDEVGFFACLRGDFREGGTVELVASGETGLPPVARATVATGPTDPVQLARALFKHQTPIADFAQRIVAHDGPLLEHAIANARRDWPRKLSLDRQYGTAPATFQTSVIVPLYGRCDFVEHQLAHFARDSSFATTELLYVIDDPALVEPMQAEAPLLAKLYGIPFRVLWGGLNRGFSGACNLGAAFAQGSTLIFLNSDVFPEEPGWVPQIQSLLADNPDFGVIAPRLIYPDGGIQHVGMAFEFDQHLGIWTNQHPLAGLPVAADKTNGLVERPAVTGACMAVRAAEFARIGGFDTGYLIGDFEDSDLCLKYRRAGKLPGYFPGISMTHLERQSVSMITGDDFRQKVVIFNAQRHFLRWGEMIRQMAGGENHA